MTVEYRVLAVLPHPPARLASTSLVRSLRSVAEEERAHLGEAQALLQALGAEAPPPPLAPPVPPDWEAWLRAQLRGERVLSTVYALAGRVAPDGPTRTLLAALQREETAHERRLVAALAELPRASAAAAAPPERLWVPHRPVRYDRW